MAKNRNSGVLRFNYPLWLRCLFACVSCGKSNERQIEYM